MSSSSVNHNNNAMYSNIGQGKYTQNSSLALNKLSNKFANHHISDQTSSALVLQQQQHSQLATDVPASYFHRSLAQSHPSSSALALASQSDSHNYVEIDTLESILYQKQQSDQSDNFQYSNTPYEMNSDNNQVQQLDLALSSPIYENQAVAIRRSESPIYSNTNPSVTSLYSNSQNLYSNLPSGIASNSSATAAYANLPSSIHHALVPTSKNK